MDSVIMLGGWFHHNPTNVDGNALNYCSNRYLYRSNKMVSYYIGNFKNCKLIDYYFYNKGENGRMTN
jgi:hypothetical protein